MPRPGSSPAGLPRTISIMRGALGHRNQARTRDGKPIGATPAIRACRRRWSFDGFDKCEDRLRAVARAGEVSTDGAGCGNPSASANHIILPLHIAALDASKPVALQVKLSYAVCGKLCVPVESDLALTLSGDGAEEATIEKAESRVPRRVALGPRNGLAVLSVRREAATPHDRVIVEVEAPAGAPVEIFVEDPAPTGRCRCPRSPPAPATSAGSSSISTACRPTPTAKARCSLSPRSPATTPSRFPPVSTNPPGTLGYAADRARLRYRPAVVSRFQEEPRHGDQGWRSSPRSEIPCDGPRRAGVEDYGRDFQGQEGSAVRRARRIHADLQQQSSARFSAERRGDQGQGHRRHRGRPA